MDKDRAFKVLALTEVNRHILDAARDSVVPEQEWEFFCECGRADCREHVVLSLERYVALRDGGGIVLAPGHRINQVERARRLVADSEALRAEAEHQGKRAIENLRRRGRLR